MKTYPGRIKTEIVPANGILVFGSNTQGKHGKGTAQLALFDFGAVYGEAKGLHGRSYGIITKDLTKYKHPSVSKEFIIEQINNLYLFAVERPEWEFYVPYQGQGENLNAYSPFEMAQMFKAPGPIPTNMVFSESFARLLNETSIQSLF
jgi:hypothetical protein